MCKIGIAPLRNRMIDIFIKFKRKVVIFRRTLSGLSSFRERPVDISLQDKRHKISAKK